MSGYTTELDEDYEAQDEAYDEAYDEAAYDEARAPRKTARPVPTANRGSAYRPRPSTSTVSQNQLQAAVARLQQLINTNSNAIKTVDGRVRSVMAEQGRTSAALRKEIADRKKDIQSVRNDNQSTRQLVALISLLTPPPTTQTVDGVQNVMIANSSSNFTAFAPLLLLAPDLLAGDSSGSGSSSNILGGGGALGVVALLAISGALGGK